MNLCYGSGMCIVLALPRRLKLCDRQLLETGKFLFVVSGHTNGILKRATTIVTSKFDQHTSSMEILCELKGNSWREDEDLFMKHYWENLENQNLKLTAEQLYCHLHTFHIPYIIWNNYHSVLQN
ncbi:uncharacterized protein LOC126475305 isoform X2 [Schistocerca serialis cubense]|uniref:uncharacterized protein LOC126475305 isoform X2 n=1 Tax=Schistocerca serialis cubense TaxID=2023355 RepID=UPI00214F1862|nr:uncharacterized protein LOC126475305 isoform X2 [Schistocerca serialis cubense]